MTALAPDQDVGLGETSLAARSKNALFREGICTMGHLRWIFERCPEQLLLIKNVGRKSLYDIYSLFVPHDPYSDMEYQRFTEWFNNAEAAL